MGCSKTANYMGSINIMVYTVKNINGTGSNASLPAGYASWIDFWEQQTGKKADACKRIGCFNRQNLDGAHVQVEGHGNYWYIVPLCHSDNMKKEQQILVQGPLVPVNESLRILW